MAQIQQEKDRLDLAPKKFVMWLFIFASFMVFAAFTSGFIVYVGGKGGHALNVILPDVFKYSTAVIVISSITLFLASRAAKRLQFGKHPLLCTTKPSPKNILSPEAMLYINVLIENTQRKHRKGGKYKVVASNK